MTLGAALERYLAAMEPRWKPSTRRACGSYARARIIPALGSLDVAAAGRADIEQFMAALSAQPSMANRCGGLLSGFFRWCERRELRPEGSNPCVGTRRYRLRGRQRWLSDAEYSRLWRALAALERHKPRQIDCIRRIALTGCRQSEIRCLRWADYRDGALHLRDAKAGPRTVWLCARARQILDRQPRDGEFAFGARSYDWLHAAWRRVLERSGLADLRLHDLRHSYASFALRRGETVATIGRLLGHRDSSTTIGYTHWHDAAAAEAARVAGEALAA